MAENQRTMIDFFKTIFDWLESSIIGSVVAIQNFEIKLKIIHMLQNISQFEGI